MKNHPWKNRQPRWSMTHSRERRRTHRALTVERLEARLPLAASVMDGLLDITGSQVADDIAIRPGPIMGDVAAFGVPGVQDGTVFHDIRAVKVDALAGNDRIRIGPLDLVPMDASIPSQPCVDVGGGFGDDVIELVSLARADGRPRMFVIDAGGGNNSTTVRFGDGTHGKVPPFETSIRTEYRSGAGRDALAVEYAGPVDIDFALLADSGAGADRLDVRLAPVAVEPPPPNPGDKVQVEPPPPNPGDNPNDPPPNVRKVRYLTDLHTGADGDFVNVDVAVPLDPKVSVATDINVNTGDGADHVMAKVDYYRPPDPGPVQGIAVADIGIDIDAGADNDFVLTQVTSAAEATVIACHIATQLGSDLVLARIDSVNPAPVATRINAVIDGGDDRDFIGFSINAAAGQQPPEQQQLPELDLYFNVSGGADNDALLATVQLGWFRGKAVAILNGEEGDDRLRFFAEAPTAGGALDAALCAIGGAGFDTAIVTQNVTPMSCERVAAIPIPSP